MVMKHSSHTRTGVFIPGRRFECHALHVVYHIIHAEHRETSYRIAESRTSLQSILHKISVRTHELKLFTWGDVTCIPRQTLANMALSSFFRVWLNMFTVFRCVCVCVCVCARLLNGYVRVNKALCQITLKTGDERVVRHLFHEGSPSSPEQQWLTKPQCLQWCLRRKREKAHLHLVQFFTALSDCQSGAVWRGREMSPAIADIEAK